MQRHWGDAAHLLRYWAPSSQHDAALRAWWARALRLGATPTAAALWLRMMADVDLRPVLASIRMPTVVVHRRGDAIVPVRNGRYLGEAIPGARYIELRGDDHLWWLGDRDGILDPIVELLGTEADEVTPEHVLAAIVSLRTPPGAARSVREEVERCGGRMLDEDLAAFDSTSRAIRCSEAVRTALKAMGHDLRAGLHIGECERHGDRLSGPAVDVARRLSGLARRDEMLVTRTVVDLVAGAGVRVKVAATTSLDGPGGPIEVCSLSADDA